MAQRSAPPDTDQHPDQPGSRLWNGMIGFGSFMLLLLGGFHVIGGFVALLDEDQYQVPSADLMISVDYNVWGILHMSLGVGMCLAGIALFYRKPWGRIAAVVFAAVGAIVNLAFLSAAPVWFAIMILLDFLVIYAVIVHYDDSEPDYYY